MRVLVCGSRQWDDELRIAEELAERYASVVHDHDILTVVEGGQKTWDRENRRFIGADYFAARWAEESVRYVLHEQYPADWEKHGKAAGPIRNTQMLNEGKPDVVLAFTDNLEESRGTKDMVTKAKAAEVPVYVIGRA